jgi:hypothetical protein
MTTTTPTPTFNDQLDELLIFSPIHPIPTAGFAADSDAALIWLPSILGPTAPLVLHRVSRYLAGTDTIVFTTDELARSFGVNSHKLRSAITRLGQFGLALQVGDRLEVATVVNLSSKQVARLPKYLQTAWATR